MEWHVEQMPDGQRWKHGGDLPGTGAVLEIDTATATSWALLVNTRLTSDLREEIQATLRELISGIQTWPRHDLF